MTIALALVFFYAPLEAEQGFLQKIFYVHVPLAIVALCGFVLGGLLAIQHLRTRDSRWDMRSYVVIHMSLIFGVATLITGSIWAQGILGALVGLERADARVVPDHLPALRDLPAAALRDRGPRAPVPLRVGLRDHSRRVRADELHRGEAVERLPASPRARAAPPTCPARWRSRSWSRWSAMALLFATLCKYELTAKHTRAQVRALRRRLGGEHGACGPPRPQRGASTSGPMTAATAGRGGL